jgi:ABC-type phosphate/phosphonate transport system substrate-binding protein
MISALVLALAGPSPAPAPIVVATYSYPRFDRRVALAPLATLVERVSGRPVRIELFDTPDALARAVCEGRADVAMTNLGAYVAMRECPATGAVAVLDTPPAVLDRYRGVLIVRADTKIATMAELPARTAGLRYSEVLPGSTSGALVQAAQLRTIGTAPARFAALRHAGTHEGALDDLFAGRADIAALAEDPWRKLQASEPERAATLRLLWRSAPLPPGPVVCRMRAAVSCTSIRKALLARTAAGVAGTLSKGWSETEGADRFRKYDPAIYAAFKAE